jgi:hypothetical protein
LVTNGDTSALHRPRRLSAWVRTIDAAWAPVVVGIGLLLVATWISVIA